MTQRTIAAAFSAIVLLAAPVAHAGFDFGGECSTGNGSFDQDILHRQVVTVGDIPSAKRGVMIQLDSPEDVDIQLIDQATGHAIIAWPNGDLNGPTQDCTTWLGTTYCYSGYNGVGGQKGDEWIEVRGDTSRPLVMKAFGYAAGDAVVTYSWDAVPTCWEKGDGEFESAIAYQATTVVGEIPRGIVDVEIELDAALGADVDIQLWDGTTKLVHWPDGLLNGATTASVEYQGMTIEYSGYNGLGGNWGHESIKVTGQVTSPLTMKAFGYQSGVADVTYAWGMGAGSTCMGIATLQCDDGYTCKAVQTGVSDPAGACHTEQWCEVETAASDCSTLMHIMTPGAWGCDEFKCSWLRACQADSDCNDGFCGWTASNARVCKPWGEAGDQCEGFVTPAYRNWCEPGLTCVRDPNDPTFDQPGTCADLSCSQFVQNCPSGYTCEFGCPNGNCGINPPGSCVQD